MTTTPSAPTHASDRARELVEEWRRFAAETSVLWRGRTRSWKEHVSGSGYDDERQLLQPSVFPAFAARLLGWQVGVNLSPEQMGAEGRPDFTPADPVTHPFVFETKSSSQGTALDDPASVAQVKHYLTEGRPRIEFVVLTNLVGLRVLTLGTEGEVKELYRVPLRDLLILDEHLYLATAGPASLARFVEQFSRKTLTVEEKIEQIAAAKEWQPFFAVTSSEWIVRRLDLVVTALQRDVDDQLHALSDPTALSVPERRAILDELHLLASRAAPGLQQFTLDQFTSAGESSPARIVLEQYAMHVAYYVATRLLLVRIWEDLGLLEPMLHDGGFRRQMARFENAIEQVVVHSFSQGGQLYRSLFAHANNYDWFEPRREVYVEAIYELAFTYLGNVDSDVLGQVYERLLTRIDRKLLGQYFTPRDVIALIWDLIGLEEVAEQTEREDRVPRILDIATGSGGFLVEAVARLRRRLERHKRAGAHLARQQWLNEVAEATNGIEIQYFSRYLAELNLLVQIGQVAATEPGLRIAPIGVIAADTLSLHQPSVQATLLQAPASDQPERARLIADVVASGFEMDVVCGNPPYIGEKLAAPLIRATRERYPYWQQFAGEHQDYLYMFLILGVSKLRLGGRFGFITTEYWLRAGGASPLREYLARNCSIERILLFRDLRLFADAPGQHSMVVVGTRRTPAGSDQDWEGLTPDPPRVSIYRGRHGPGPIERVALLDAMRAGKDGAQVKSFNASVAPNALGGGSWADVVLTRGQRRQRARLRRAPQTSVVVTKGVETTVNKLTAKTASKLTATVLDSLGWPERHAGIQLLSSAEVARLGQLNDAERRTLRPVINTKDVYPYAAVLEREPDYVIYLPKPSEIDRNTCAIEARNWPFPGQIPTLERYLDRFEPILRAAVDERKETRPWWSLHRDRIDDIGVGSSERWEPFCLTARWGSGARLVVGLAPGRGSPASGLHVVRAGPDVENAAVLCGLYNSSLYQAIVDSLPPGNLRAEDILAIGTPELTGEARRTVAECALELADLVHALVVEDGALFPLLHEQLRRDVSLSEVTLDVWTPKPGPSTRWGQLDQVGWVRDLQVLRASKKIGDVSIEDTLLGRIVRIAAGSGAQTAIEVKVDLDAPHGTRTALAAMLSGERQRGANCAEVARLLVPTEANELVESYERHSRQLVEHAERYRSARAEIDRTLAGELDEQQ